MIHEYLYLILIFSYLPYLFYILYRLINNYKNL